MVNGLFVYTPLLSLLSSLKIVIDQRDKRKNKMKQNKNLRLPSEEKKVPVNLMWYWLGSS